MGKYYQAYDKRYQEIHELKLQWSSDVVTPILQKLITQYKIRKMNKILEIGCGEGRDALWLLEQGYDVLGTDVSGEAISYCKKKNPKFSHLFCQLDVCEESLPQTFKKATTHCFMGWHRERTESMSCLLSAATPKTNVTSTSRS